MPTPPPPRTWLGRCAEAFVVLLILGFGAALQAAPTVSFPAPAPAGITDQGTSHPFATATLGGAVNVYVTIQYPKDAGTLGSASGLSSAISGSDIIYTLSTRAIGTAQSDLRGILFTPTENRIPITGTETTVFRVRAVEAPAQSDEATVSLVVTPVNDSPNLTTGAARPQIYDNQTTAPFANSTLTDPDAGDILEATITYPSAHGVLSAGTGSPALTLSGGAGNYTVQGSRANLESFLQKIVYNPTDNRLPVWPAAETTESTVFTVVVEDLAGDDDFGNFIQSVASFNDTPRIVGNLAAVPIPDSSDGYAVFTPLTIEDPDLVKVGGSLVPQPVELVADLAVTGEAAGAGVFIGSALKFTFDGTAAPAPGNNEVTAALHDLLFDPTPNRLAVGETESRPVRLTVTDSLNLSTVQDLSFTVESKNDTPSVYVGLRPSTVPDTGLIQPFLLTVTDADVGERFRIEIVPVSDPTGAIGSFEPAGPFTADTAEQLAGVMAGVAYRPAANQPANRDVTFKLRLTDIHSSSASPTEGPSVDSALLKLTVLGVNDPPQIAVPSSTRHRTTDDANQAIELFKGVSISDADSPLLTVTLSIEGRTQGTFRMGALSGPTLVFQGDAATVSQNIHTVTFTATPRLDRVVGDVDTIVATISVDDGAGGTRVDRTTKLVVTSVNGAPVIQNVPALADQPLRVNPATPGNPIRPFDFGTVAANSKLTITDDDGTNVVVTIKMDDPDKGHFENLGGFVEVEGKTSARTGIYTLTALPADATLALRGLEFVVNDAHRFPPSEPGKTQFGIEVQDTVLNLASKSLTIVVADEPVNWLVTSDQDNADIGTLRWVLNQIQAGNSASAFVTFALPSYPAVIRLAQGPITLPRNVTLKGPGADLLAISGDVEGDGLPDVALFRVEAVVRMEGLTLTHGAAISGLNLTGGAAYVGPTGKLTLVSCAVRNSMALLWGGGIDVDGGSLALENCLVRDNMTDEALGLGGGGIALFTDQPCSFLNTTFSANTQLGGNGVGGGGLYVENLSPTKAFDVLVDHCTFAENTDASEVGATSLFANVFGSGVRVRNSIFADGQTRNLEVAGAASIISLGGNLSDDRTRTVLTQDGQPKEVFLLDHTTDLKNVAGTVASQIDEALRPLPAYPLPRSSRAIGHAVSPAPAIDQSGNWRDSSPDSGALERGAGPRLVLNEIGFGAPSFLEFYVPRDAKATALAGSKLRVNGTDVFTFPANTTVLPGFGLIVSDAAITPITCVPLTPDCPAPTPVLTVPAGTLGVGKRSLVEVLSPDRRVVLSVNYVGQFVDPEDPLNTTKYDGTSITLAPQLRGCAYLPHGIVSPGPLSGRDPLDSSPLAPPNSPGGTITTPFGSPNGFPFAVADAFVVGEDVAVDLAVLSNDFEEDGTDRKVLVDVSPAASPLSENDGTAATALGGQVTIVPSASPLRGASITYDPQGSSSLKALPVGYEAVDTFTYTIVDIGSGEIESIASSDGGTTSTLQVTGHRLANGEQISVAGSDTAAYNGTYAATVVDADHFKISVPFVDSPAEPGRWETVNPRSPTQRSQATVSVTVLGANDPPVAAEDSVPSTEADEDTPIRLMAGPSLTGIATDFDTDKEYVLKPRISHSQSLLGGTVVGGIGRDSDPDRNETDSLRVIGVVGVVHAIAGFAKSADTGEVIVSSTAHGLSDGVVVLISGYTGYNGYNGFHAVTVVDVDHFRMPVAFVDDVAAATEPHRGIWGILTDENRLRATTSLGAAVRLDLRVDPLETSVVYDPTPSAILNALSVTDPARADEFYYAVSDLHGAVSLGRVTVHVAGVNDAPVAVADPAGLGQINTLVPTGGSLATTLGSLEIAYYLPPESGTPNRADVALLTPDQPPAQILLADAFQTDEEHAIVITRTDLTGNDADVDQSDALRVRSTDATSRGGAQVTLQGDGSVRYNPVPSARLQMLAREEGFLDSFMVTITDDRGGDSSALVAVLVVGVNDTPVAVNDLATTNEDTAVSLNPLVNDSDKDQDGHAPDNILRLVPETKTTPFGARVTIDPALFTYDPTTSAYLNGLAVGQTASERVGTTTMDGSFLFANDDHYQVAADGSGFVLDVVNNDRNLTGTGRPVVSYSGEVGQAPVRVVATGHGLSTGMMVDIGGYGGAGLYNRAHRVEVVDADTFLIPAVYVDNAATKGLWTRLQIASLSSASAGGTAAIDASKGVIVYSPAVNFVGEEVFAYTLVDDLGNSDSALVRVRVVVNQLNGNLQAKPDHFTVARGQNPVLDVLANDNIIPAPGQSLTLGRIVAQPVLQSGAATPRDSVEIVDNRIRYLQTYVGAATDYPYEVAFSYEISGGGTARAVATVIVRVVDRGDTLPTRDDAFAVLAGSLNNTLTVLDNDRILPGSTEVIAVDAIVQSPSRGGAARVSADGNAVIYSPAAGFVGEETFTYRATDRLGGTGLGTVTVAVGGLTSSSDFVAVPYNGGPTEIDVLANDPILGSAQVGLTLTSVRPANPLAPVVGALSVRLPDQQRLIFEPTPGAEGEQEFIYTFADQSVPPKLAEGHLIVIVARESVRGSSDFFGVAAGSSLNPLAVLANDVAIPDRGRSLTVVSIGTGLDAPNHGGTVVINATRDGLVYTPASGFIGEETFTYTMTDSRNTDTAKVVVSVGAGRLAADPDAFVVFFDPAGGREFDLPVLANDRVLPDDGQYLTITGVGIDDVNGNNAPSEHGEVSIAPGGGSLTYVARPDAVPPYTERFTYEITDGTARRAQAVVLVRVENRVGARALETNGDFYTVAKDSSANLLPVFENDGVKPAGTADWTISDITTPTWGGVAVAAGRNIVFTPAPGFVGTSTFNYAVSDGLGGTATALVTVKIGDLAPSLDAFSAISGSTGNILDVLNNDAIRPESSSANYFLASAGGTDKGGSVQVSDGVVLYRPAASAASYPYLETFNYIVEDDSGGQVTERAVVEVHAAGSDRAGSEVVMTITGVNDAPTLTVTPPGVSTITDKQTVRPFLGVTIADVDDQGNELLEVRVVQNDPAAGRLTTLGGFVETSYGSGAWVFNGTGAQATTAIRGLTFVPTENYVPVPSIWSFAFDILVTDPYVTQPVAGVVTVRVQAVNDAPIISGTVARQPVNYRGSIRPFASVLITEVDDRTLQALAVTVRFDATHGTFVTTGGFAQTSPGLFTFFGTAETATVALRAMVFAPATGNRLVPDLTPPPEGEETVFTIAVNDRYVSPVVTDAITSVIAYHSLVTKIIASDGAKPDQFGTAVGASRNLVAVGAPNRDGPLKYQGGVYVYARDAGGPTAWGQVAQLDATDITSGIRFGYSVSVSDERIAAGAPAAKVSTKNPGAAYVFEPTAVGGVNWQANAVKLTSSDGANDDQFGYAVSMSGDFLAVGAPTDDDKGTSSGAVYIFRRTAFRTWIQVAKIVPADAIAGDQFGFALSMSGDGLIVSSPFAGPNGKESGAAYVYRRNADGTVWTQVRKLLPTLPPNLNDGHQDDRFGYSAALDGDTAVVGAPRENGGRTKRGSAYVFQRNLGGVDNWGQVVKIGPSDAMDYDDFGRAVTISKDLIALGMPFDGKHPDYSKRSGSAWIFGRNQGGAEAWGFIEKLDPPDNSKNDEFGRGIALACGTLVVGGRKDDTVAKDSGSAYIFDLSYGKAPRSATPIPQQLAVVGEPFSFVIPAGTFGEADVGDTLTLAVAPSVGGPLPAWLSFAPATATLSGTPAAANVGTLVLVVKATDRCGDSASTLLTIKVQLTRPPVLPPASAPLTYEQWIARLLPTRILSNLALQGTVWGRTANPDFDNFINLEEYAFGTPLFTAGANDGPGLTIGVAPDGRIAVSFRRRTNDASLRFTLEFSADLDVWTDAATLPKEEKVFPIGNNLEAVTDLLPADQLTPNLFLRVRISTL